MKLVFRLTSLFCCIALLFCSFGCSSDSQPLIDPAAADAVPLQIGIWVPPGPSLTATAEETDIRYKQIADAGVNLVFGIADGDTERLSNVLDACEKYGLRYIVTLSVARTGVVDTDAVTAVVEQTKNHPAVLAYNLMDEPSAERFESLAALRETVDALLPEGKFSFCNLFPNYASVEQLTGMAGAETGYDDPYFTYLQQYMQTVKPKVLSFDHYPFSASPENDKNTLYAYLHNLSLVRGEAAKAGVPFWGFLQTIGWDGYRVPGDGELLWLCNTHILFGAKSLSHYLYWDLFGNPATAQQVTYGMLSFEGEPTDIYARAQKIAAELHAYDKAFMPFLNYGVIAHNIDADLLGGVDEKLLLQSYAGLSAIECEGSLLIGCMDRKGQPGLYVMNFNYVSPTEATLRFSDRARFEVWGAGGLEQSCNGNSASFALRPGEAKFVVFEKP